MSISIHCPRIGHATMEMLCGDSQVEDWCKQLLQGWKGAILDSRDISLHYWSAWSSFVDVTLSTAVAKSMSPWHFINVMLKSIATFYLYWKSVYTTINPVIGAYMHSHITGVLDDLRTSNPGGKWRTWLEESGAKLQGVLASRTLPKRW